MNVGAVCGIFHDFPVGELCDRPLFDYLRSQLASVTKEHRSGVYPHSHFLLNGQIEPIMNLADQLVFDTLEPMKILRHSVTRYSMTAAPDHSAEFRHVWFFLIPLYDYLE